MGIILAFAFPLYFLTFQTTYAKAPDRLPELIKEASQNNPEIKAAHDRWLAEIQTITQAQSLPDPKITAVYTNLSGDKPLESVLQGLESLGGMQEVPFPIKLYLKGKIATLGSKEASSNYQATYLTVTSNLKQLYYELYFVNKSIEILEKNRILLEEMEKSASTNYSVGKAPQQDIFRAQTEISRILMRLVKLRQKRTSLQADINRLLNRSLELEISTPNKLMVTSFEQKEERLYTLVTEQAPSLAVYKREVEKERESIKLSKMEYFSDVELEGNKLKNSKLNVDGYQVKITASVPLYFTSKQNKAVRESTDRYSAALEDFQNTYKALTYQVKDAFLIAKRSEELIVLIRDTILPQAALTFTSSQANYGTASVDFLTFLNNLLTLQENELELEEEIMQHEKAIAQIEGVVGAFL